MTRDEGANSDSDGSQARLRLHIVTLFPRIFTSWLEQGVVSRAVQRGVATVDLVDLRPFGIGRHHVTDDYPFGGGAGMIMKPEPLFAAVESIPMDERGPVVLLTPGGRVLHHDLARELAQLSHFVLLAGHYEGVDERVRRHLVDDEVSVGDYVLSSGELAAMVVADATVRLVPGAISEGSADDESFVDGLLEYPHYTRPAEFRGWSVPEVLVSGNHARIESWRRSEAIRTTLERRRDLMEMAKETEDALSDEGVEEASEVSDPT